MRALLKACVPFMAIIWVAGTSSTAQVKVPRPPDAYDVHLRYRIQANRDERVLQYEAMTKYLGSLGFKENESDEGDLAPFDLNAEMMSGTIASKNAREILRERRVQTILLAPAGYSPPEDTKSLVRVAIELSLSKDQLLLFNQVAVALRSLDFRMDVGFDTRNFTLIRGSIPSGNTMKLLRDLRHQPSGWLLPETAPDLIAVLPDGAQTPTLVKPFGDAVPVRVVEIMGGAEAAPMVVVLPPIAADQPHLAKLTADLRRKLVEEGVREKPVRLEVVLTNIPIDLDLEWRIPFIRVGAEIEGRVGPVVTVLIQQGAKADALAAIPEISSVRLPRISRTGVVPAKPKEEHKPEDKKVTAISFNQDSKLPPAPTTETDPLKRAGVDRLHSLGKMGQKISVVILDSDFSGWESLVPKGDQAPGKVKFLDLTAERNRDVRPEPMPGDNGHGTLAAKAVRLAAPSADLTLIRVPADAPYHVINVARSIRGNIFRTEGLVTRRLEIEADQDNLRLRQRDARDEYRKAFDDFSDEVPARQRRIAAQQMLKKLSDDDAALRGRLGRVEQFEYDLSLLKGTRVVLSLQSWDTGFALDGASAVSRYLDEWLTPSRTDYVRQLGKPRPDGLPLWFQPAGDTTGQTWTGLFRDVDRNGVMEFATDELSLKPERWSRELNFLSSRRDSKDVLDLAAGAKVRISVQWREPHDSSLPEEDYRAPIVPLKLQLVKQRDPSGKKYASDEIDLIAESEGLPARLHFEPHFAVYEHTLELSLPADGRYAIRLEGRMPQGVRPATVPILTGQEVTWELRPRLFVESADGQTQFFLGDYASQQGGVSVPADARSVFAVGAAGPDGKPRVTSAAGAGPETSLATKPNLLGPDTIPAFKDTSLQGTELAASFTAGWAAAVLSAGLPASSFPHGLGIAPGGSLAVPENWLRR
ncbi:MAG: hypothetical protein EXS09_09810 [Gemmataceae bacterium]|nr:hypothetical protein [Gemmataceae bacterium]